MNGLRVLTCIMAFILAVLPTALADMSGDELVSQMQDRAGQPTVDGFFAGERVFLRDGNSMGTLHISSIDTTTNTLYSDIEGAYSGEPHSISSQNLWAQLPLPRHSDPLLRSYSRGARVSVEGRTHEFNLEGVFQNPTTGEIVAQVTRVRSGARNSKNPETLIVPLANLRAGDAEPATSKLGSFLKAFDRSHAPAIAPPKPSAATEVGLFPGDSVHFRYGNKRNKFMTGVIQAAPGNRIDISPSTGGRLMVLPPEEVFLSYGLKELGPWIHLFDPASKDSQEWKNNELRIKAGSRFPQILDGKPNTWLVVNYLENPVTGEVLAELARTTPTPDVPGSKLTRQSRIVGLDELGDLNGFAIGPRVMGDIRDQIRRSGRAEYFQTPEVQPKSATHASPCGKAIEKFEGVKP